MFLWFITRKSNLNKKLFPIGFPPTLYWKVSWPFKVSAITFALLLPACNFHMVGHSKLFQRLRWWIKFWPHSEMLCCRSPAPLPLNTSPVPRCSPWPLALPRLKSVVQPLTTAASLLYWWCQSRLAQVYPFFDIRFFWFKQGLMLFIEWEICNCTNFFCSVSTPPKNQIVIFGNIWRKSTHRYT